MVDEDKPDTETDVSDKPDVVEKSLLDEESGSTDTDDGEDDKDDDVAVEDAIVAKVVAALESKFDSIADRRVNAILKEVRNKGVDKKDDKESRSSRADDKPLELSHAGDVREARMAYREYVVDGGFKFLGDVEREHAMTLAQGLIPGLLAEGNDPDEAGRAAAKKVSTTVKGLRALYEQKTLAALRRSGQIASDGRGDGRTSAGGKTRRGDDSSFKAGQAKAREMFANQTTSDQK